MPTGVVGTIMAAGGTGKGRGTGGGTGGKGGVIGGAAGGNIVGCPEVEEEEPPAPKEGCQEDEEEPLEDCCQG